MVISHMERAFMEMLDMTERDGMMYVSLLLYLSVAAGGQMWDDGRLTARR